MMLRLGNRILTGNSRIWALLVVFVVLSVLYSVVVPIFEASDELWHYPMVKYIADNWALPVQDPQNVGPWRQEGSQPPLYYFIGALATFWIDTTDIDVVRHLNPHADKGIATPDGNINLITHHPKAESFPWRGTALAVHLVRFLSILMGAATVYLTYRLALELIPDRPNLALTVAAINAFTPMFVFISSAVNNDNLVIPLCSLALLLMVRLIKTAQADRGAVVPKSPAVHHPSRIASHLSRFILLGLVIGFALLTKESAGGLILLTALTVAYVSWRERSLWTFFIGGLTTGGASLLIAGWWYIRNWRLYGDPTGQNVFIEILGQRDVRADLTQLWRERISFVRGYWGNFGGLNVPMPEWVYLILDVLLVLAILGLFLVILTHVRSLLQRRRHEALADRLSASPEEGQLASWLVVLLWPVLVVALWITWAATTWSSQGRLVFSALSVWSLLMTLGWRTLADLPLGIVRRGGQRSKERWSSVTVLVPIFMFGISLIAPFAWIRPAYARPPTLTDAEMTVISQRVDAVFFHPAGGQLKLLGYDAPVPAAYPGQPVPVTLYWEAIEPFAQDYSIFLHLVDTHDLVVAQRDAFPGMGTLCTQWLSCAYWPADGHCQAIPGQLFDKLGAVRWAERRVLNLPETAFSPNQTVFEVGLYDVQTGERLTAVTADGRIAGDHVRFGQLEIRLRSADWPNPITIDFGGKMELVGYDLDRRALRQREVATLILYWRGQRPLATNYSISTQFVNASGVKAAQVDAWPFEGAAPTSLWEPGKLVQEPRQLVVFEGTPAGVYDVYVAVYPSGDPEALLVVTPPGGRLQTDHVVLTTIRVLP